MEQKPVPEKERFITSDYTVKDNPKLSFTVRTSEVLRFTPTGEIYVRGALATNDAEIVNALREWAKVMMQNRL